MVAVAAVKKTQAVFAVASKRSKEVDGVIGRGAIFCGRSERQQRGRANVQSRFAE